MAKRTDATVKRKTPRYLGKQVNEYGGRLDVIRITDRERPRSVTLECSEFTSLCPVTLQPDYGKLLISYEPGPFLVETKSLKLFLQTYRHRREYNEVIIAEIAQRFFEQVSPICVTVSGQFNQRGGIAVTAQHSLYQESD